ncbi:glycosyltransferase [Bacillus sp. S14(2024)]|uniref:glycosyltransferase n=1 Tax=Bacillus sp. S14(2024) TaxID=3162884 RepID=UPI003D1A46B8
MKKKLLFVTNDLNCDGASKSLLSLLEQIDYKNYDVDLLLFAHRGMFMNMIPKEVNVLPPITPLKEITLPFTQSIGKLLSCGKWGLAYRRTRYLMNYYCGMSVAKAMQQVWPFYAQYVGVLKKEYDVAISYQDYWSKYFIAEKTVASKKLAWNHCNLSKVGMDIQFEEKYNKLIDYWITISDECKDVLNSMFPDMLAKTYVIENIISPSVVRRMAIEDVPVMKENFSGCCIVTVGRLSHEKGIDLALDACLKLVQCGYDIRWYIIGEGKQKSELEKKIRKNNLQDRFILLGVHSNPYPFMKHAEIYVQPSRTEGKSIAIEEAKSLGKSIVVTNYQTVASQIVDMETGLISSISGEGLFIRVRELLDKPELHNLFSINLDDYKGNESEIDKFYELIGREYYVTNSEYNSTCL